MPWLEVTVFQQDYLWFCVLLLWAGLGTCLVARNRTTAGPIGTAWPWLTVASGALLALVELMAPVVGRAAPDEEMAALDLGLFSLQFVQALAPLTYFGSDRGASPGRRRLAWTAGAGIVLALTLSRRFAFIAVDTVALILVVAGSLWVARHAVRSHRVLAVAALLAAVAFFVGTTGLLSELLQQPRRFIEASPLALPSIALQASLALLWLWPLLPTEWVRSGATRDPFVRWLWPALGLWIASGFVMAWLAGRTARTGFEESLLSRARICTGLLRLEGVEAILQPAFRLERLESTPQPGGRRSLNAVSSHLPEAGRRTRHDLAHIHSLNPDIYWAFFLTFRSGYLVTASLSDLLPAKKDAMAVIRPVGPRDLAAWADRLAYVEGPLLMDYGQVLRICAPVVRADGRMLGWLTFETAVTAWARAQAVARFQAFALTGVGTALLLSLLVLRRRTAAREEARRIAAEAAAADQAKTVFLAKVSHELRTPVQSLLGYGELLQSQPLSRQGPQWLAAIISQSRLLIRLVNDLIDLSASQADALRLHVRTAAPAPLVRQTVETLRGMAAAKSLDLQWDCDPAVPDWLEFDAERLRQVVTNLVANAIKFTARGEVRVRLAAVPDSPGWTTLSLTVSDTGSGLSADEQARLFEPFHRLERHAKIEGAGLGLALCRSLCEKMGGSLSVHSDGRNGATFTASLRARQVRAPLPTPPASPATSVAGCRVLVADDNTLVAELYLTALQAAGAVCEHASTGMEAVSLAASGGFDVVVMDLSMPGLDGCEACRRIRAQPGNIRVIGVSAHAQDDTRNAALAAGMEVLLVKPVSLPDLLAAVGSGPPPSHPACADLGLFHRLQAQFDRELPALCADIQAAVDDADAIRLRERVHYLKNSADVMQAAEISRLCLRVEQALTEAAEPAPHVLALLATLDRRLIRLANPLPGTPPESQP